MNNALSRADSVCSTSSSPLPSPTLSAIDSDALFIPANERTGSSQKREAGLDKELHTKEELRSPHSPAQHEPSSVFLKIDEQPATMEIQCPAGTSLSRKIVLVVDDEPAILAVMKIALVKSGFQVLVANNGAEALEKFELMRGQIKVLITDMAMPGMNGLELIRLIREFNDSVEIVATTGMTTMDQMQAIRDADVQHVLSKPCGSRQLIALVRNLFSLP